MELFLVALSMAFALGFAWVIDREHFYYHLATVSLLELCTLFWIVFPRLK